ncbi:hypothetical protein WOC68_10240 [Staphylococcus aureus]
MHRGKTLTRYGSQIIQNGKEIKLRTTKEEFNATNRTLSNMIKRDCSKLLQMEQQSDMMITEWLKL